MKTQIIYCEDNLKRLKLIPSETIDLAYIDPPFGTSTEFTKFSGQGSKQVLNEEQKFHKYINWIKPRLQEIHRILKTTGSFYIYCDASYAAYLRTVLDKIFGVVYFRSQIIVRKSRRVINKFHEVYPKNYDVILFYTKSNDYIFNLQFTPVSISEDSNYRFTDEDGRKYRLVSLTSNDLERPGRTFEFMGIKRTWKSSRERMEQAQNKGLIIQTSPDAVPALKEYLDEKSGNPIDDLWLDILPPTRKEKFGYISQQPLALLDRIIKISSNANNIVLDAFCGSGTTLHAAQNLSRRWIGIDNSPVACRVTLNRLEKSLKLKEGLDFSVEAVPKDKKLITEYAQAEFESWVLLAMSILLRGNGNIASMIKYLCQSESPRISSTSFRSAMGADFLIGQEERWLPVEVKRSTKIKAADISAYQTLLKRHSVRKGLLVALNFSKDAQERIRLIAQDVEIIPATIDDILQELEQA
jgi:DNA modification methylase